MRIGTVLHGALGDVYEQALSFSILKKARYADDQLIAFFATQDRLDAFKHYDLHMFDEIHLWDKIPHSDIERFDQFQIKDPELPKTVFNFLPESELNKFNFKQNWLPWKVLAAHDFSRTPLRLNLSETGLVNYHKILAIHGLDAQKLSQSVGFLWRYRTQTDDMVKPIWQVSRERIIQSKSELFNRLHEDYGLNLVVAGMNYRPDQNQALRMNRTQSGVLDGEINAKFASEKLFIEDNNVTYLQGLSYSAELEIIANTRFQVLMPSGFSEPIWMMNREKALLVDSPPIYLLKLLRHRMPLFDHNSLNCWLYNMRNHHSADRVLKELNKRKLLTAITTQLNSCN